MKRLSFILTAFLFAVFTCFAQEVRIGEPLPMWQTGEHDVHFISTGHGECAYHIFPDGTTFMVDASGHMNRKVNSRVASADWKPNEEATPGHTISNYIKHFSPEVSKGHINYVLVTHHHGDHMGVVSASTPWHKSNKFQLSSLCEIGSELIMDKIFDRDWPDFDFPRPSTGLMMENYKDFLRWTMKKNKTVVEKWDVGSSKQVVPLHDNSYNFTIRNLAGSGCCAAEGEGSRLSYMPPKQVLDGMSRVPNENYLSCAFLLSYGKFDLYAGGDLMYAGRDKYPYQDAETPLIAVTPKVEVVKANHHGCTGSHCAEFINHLAPDVWLVGVWCYTSQPAPGPTKRVIDANPNVNIFCTFQSEENIGLLAEKVGADEVDSHVVGRGGHVVVRVAPGGDSFMVYVLDDNDEEYRVKSIHGPYQCHE